MAENLPPNPGYLYLNSKRPWEEILLDRGNDNATIKKDPKDLMIEKLQQENKRLRAALLPFLHKVRRTAVGRRLPPC